MKKISYLLFAVLSSTVLFMNCGEDRTHEFVEKTEENQWIYSTMKEYYLWGDSIKSPAYSSFFSSTSKFFESMLDKKDKVSCFTDSVRMCSYGFSFAFMRDPLGIKPGRYYALVLYVEPGSPASAVGIERGTWISEIDGKAMSSTGNKLLLSGDAIDVTTCSIGYEGESLCWNAGDTLSMHAANVIESKAVYIDTTYDVGASRVGYVVCMNLNGNNFAADIQNVMLDFAAADVTDIIIDLRYCSEGTIDNANAMASALVPVSLAGTPFAVLKGRDGTDNTICNYVEQTVNLSDKRVFFITGNSTRGIAELLVASVKESRGVGEVYVAGARTAGTNMFTRCFDSPYGFSISPVVAFISSSGGGLLPQSGIVPDCPIDELAEIELIYKLGDEQEYILYNILYLIANELLPTNM